ncbi:MAG TPA: cyclic nucleotide-binding domain-containing protein [Terriglobales bacterium]|nr:cyclic nucleotide-binding domain-containing protein [Terriglobales bacterium]
MKLITTAKRTPDFNPHTFLSTIGKGRVMVSFQKKSKVFAQGDSRDGLFFVQTGKVQLSVVSEDGREAVLGILGEGDFFGEGGLAGQLLRMSSATALTDCVLLHIERKAMMHTMSLEPKLSAMFVKYLLKRNIRYQDDLVRSTFQFQRKAVGASSSLDGSIRQSRSVGNVSPKTKSGDSGRDGRDDTLAGQLFHESI